MKTIEFIKGLTMEEMEKFFSSLYDTIFVQVTQSLEFGDTGTEPGELAFKDVKVLMAMPRLRTETACRINENWLKNNINWVKDSAASNNYEYVKNVMSADELATLISIFVSDAVRDYASRHKKVSMSKYDHYVYPLRGLKGRTTIRKWLEAEIE